MAPPWIVSFLLLLHAVSLTMASEQEDITVNVSTSSTELDPDTNEAKNTDTPLTQNAENITLQESQLTEQKVNDSITNTTLATKQVCLPEHGCLDIPLVNCLNMSALNDSNITGIVGQEHVINVTSKQLEYLLENPLFEKSCLLVMYYAVWCSYSIEFIPRFNRLGKQFPQLTVVALDFGAKDQETFLLAYIPRILFYYSGRPVYNIDTSMTDEELQYVLANMTGYVPIPVSDEEMDQVNSESPLPLEWQFDSTWYNLSLLGIVLILAVHLLKRTIIINWIAKFRDVIRNTVSKLKTD